MIPIPLRAQSLSRSIAAGLEALGTGLGTALGVKLARPQQVVVCIVGDGAWHYNPAGRPRIRPGVRRPAANRAVQQPRVRVPDAQYPEVLPRRRRGTRGALVGDVIQPTPDYVMQVEAYGGLGERVENLDELGPALQRALTAVAAGRTFMVDVVVESQVFAISKHDGGQPD